MSKNLFFASAAKAAFALAAVVMMSAVFTSCSKDDDDDDAKKFTNTVTFGGMEKPIVKAEYEDRGSGDYKLFLYLEAVGAERMEIQLNKGLHMNGTPIDLREKEEKHSGLYWGVTYYTPDGEAFFNTFAGPSSPIPVFSDGTLTVNGDPVTGINIKLENGLVIGKDDNEHTITMSYSGKMTVKKKKKK